MTKPCSSSSTAASCTATNRAGCSTATRCWAELKLANGGHIRAVPKGENQIRIHHPHGYLMDEAAFLPEAQQCYDATSPCGDGYPQHADRRARRARDGPESGWRGSYSVRGRHLRCA